jgi:hypothetical protein
MNTITSLLRRARHVRRRSVLSVWSDARSQPLTEGQAIVAPGHIGPEHVRAERLTA